MSGGVSFWRSAGLSLLILALFLGVWEIAVMPKSGGGGAALDPEYAALLGQAAAQGGTTPMPGPSAIGKRLLELLADPFYVRGAALRCRLTEQRGVFRVKRGTAAARLGHDRDFPSAQKYRQDQQGKPG